MSVQFEKGGEVRIFRLIFIFLKEICEKLSNRFVNYVVFSQKMQVLGYERFIFMAELWFAGRLTCHARTQLSLVLK